MICCKGAVSEAGGAVPGTVVRVPGAGTTSLSAEQLPGERVSPCASEASYCPRLANTRERGRGNN
jgi:hypothetical protein